MGCRNKIILNIAVYIATIIFLVFVWQYNQHLLGVQAQYENVILRAFYVVDDPHFYQVMLAGLAVVLILICFSVWDVHSWKELGIFAVAILIIVHVILLIAIIEAYANPMFTSFAITCSFGAIVYTSKSVS